jgi:hypothetical protein
MAMKANALTYIQTFLHTHGWQKQATSKYFDCYAAPANLQLPSDFYLEVPRDMQDNGYVRYTDSLIDVLQELYGDLYNIQSIQTFFNTDNAILSLQLEDEDTVQGKVRFERLKALYENSFSALKKLLIFEVTRAPIFGKAQMARDINPYLNRCRGLQTSMGSYGVKLELPESLKLELFPNDASIPRRFVETLEFLVQTTTPTQWNRVTLDKTFIQRNSRFINIELLDSLVKWLKEASISKLRLGLDHNQYAERRYFAIAKPQLKRMELLVSTIRAIILQENPLELDGNVIKLSSKKPSLQGTIWMEGTISDEKITVEVRLSSEDYAKAAEAHTHGRSVHLVGIAKPTANNRYLIETLKAFE